MTAINRESVLSLSQLLRNVPLKVDNFIWRKVTRALNACKRKPAIRRVVLRVKDGLLTYQDHHSTELDKITNGAWSELAKRYPGMTITRLFSKLTEVDSANDRFRRLRCYFVVTCPPDCNLEDVKEQLKAWKNLIDTAYVDKPWGEYP
jgi:hypothetical protein